MVKELDIYMIQALLEMFQGMPDQQLNEASCHIQGMPFGQQSSKRPRNATAFPWRNRIVYNADAACDFANATQANQTYAFLGDFVENIQPWCQGMCLDTPQRNVSDYPRTYWKANRQRLQEVRSAWNPHPWTPLSFEQEVPLLPSQSF
jgi:hypothetical protein